MINILDYEIKEPIGKGGMATVYRAIHKRLQREVALKVMAPEVSSSTSFQKSFFTEGRTVAKLEHPNIVKIHDINAANGHFYMSMELLRKGSLKQLLANKKLSLPNILNIIKQIASALHYAHQKGFIHRDIKPANIMFREDGSTVLTDFGIAKMQGTTSEMTQMGYVAGTPYYMAPEQATGQQIDERADIYSLGIVFYEMLTGDKPYVANNTVAITYKHVHDPVPTLAGKSKIFQKVLNKALAKQPEQRFDTAQSFSEALSEITQLNTLTNKKSLAVFSNNAVHEKRSIWPWLVVIAATSISGIAGTYYYSKSTEEKRFIEEQANFSRRIELQKESEAQEKIKIAADKKIIQIGNINNHLSIARILHEKRRIFDHSTWSKGCRSYLESIDGPYNHKDTSEWHYKQILSIDINNQAAQRALVEIKKRKKLDFSNCYKYQYSTNEDPLKGLFEN